MHPLPELVLRAGLHEFRGLANQQQHRCRGRGLEAFQDSQCFEHAPVGRDIQRQDVVPHLLSETAQRDSIHGVLVVERFDSPRPGRAALHDLELFHMPDILERRNL